MRYFLQWLRRLVAGLLPRRPGFAPGSWCVICGGLSGTGTGPLPSSSGWPQFGDVASPRRHEQQQRPRRSVIYYLPHPYHSFINFPVVPNLEHRAPFGVSVITLTIRHTVGLLWTSDQPVAETSTCTGQHNTQTSIPSAGFEPATPITKLPQTYALDGAATGIGLVYVRLTYLCRNLQTGT
jgi:hypothetical protein